MNGKKCIFITGAASGIGRATALLFAERGWFVGLYDVNGKGLEALSVEIGKGSCCHAHMDVADLGSVKKAVDHFSKRTGGNMHVLFNNAGIIEMGAHESIPIEKQIRIVDTNLKGLLHCAHAGLPLLKNTENARIINMSSASSLYGTAHMAVYSATKAAVSSLTESLNLEFEKLGIFVCDVRSPFVRTPLLERDVKAPAIDKLGVHLMPEEVARVVWKATQRKRIHNNTRGIMSLLVLLKLPNFIRMKVIKYLLLP